MNFNFDKPPVVEQKKDNSVEGKRTNWEKSKKYLKMLALGGFITLATFGGKKVLEQGDIDDKRDDLRDQIENFEKLWSQNANENIEMQKDTYAFINESDLFLKEGINNKNSQKFEMYLQGVLNSDAIVSRSITPKDGIVDIEFDESKMENISLERSPDSLSKAGIKTYTRPDHYIIFDNVPENNTPDQDADLINIKIVDMETGKIREVFFPKDNPFDVNLDNIPDDLYMALAQKVNLEKETL